MRYAVRERMFSIGEDFWITDEQGNRVLLADGKVMRLRQTVELKDGSGAVVAVVRKKLMAVRETMEIERDGALAATVHKALISPLHHRSAIDLADDVLQGNANIVVEDVGEGAIVHRRRRPNRDPFRIHRHDEHADTGVRRLRVFAPLATEGASRENRSPSSSRPSASSTCESSS